MVKQIKPKPFFIFLALVIVFTAGLLFGKSSTGENELATMLQQSELSTESYVLEQDLLSNLDGSACSLAKMRIQQQSDELYRIGKRLESENSEQELGKNTYTFLKKKYHLLQIRTYALYKKISDQCELPVHVVLFYYSRDDQPSAKQGKVLDELVEEYTLVVFAIEYQYAPELSFLEQYYHIKKTPSVVVDFDKVLEGEQDSSSLARYFTSS